MRLYTWFGRYYSAIVKDVYLEELISTTTYNSWKNFADVIALWTQEQSLIYACKSSSSSDLGNLCI